MLTDPLARRRLTGHDGATNLLEARDNGQCYCDYGDCGGDHDDHAVTRCPKLAQIEQIAKGVPFAIFQPDLVKYLFICYLIY